MKYITRKNNQYYINKSINGKIIYCGSYNTLDEAKQVRDYLATYNWNTDLIDCLKEKNMAHIYNIKDGYKISKSINGVEVYFGVYKYLSIALLEKQLFIWNNWDIDDIP